jgi:putative transposase
MRDNAFAERFVGTLRRECLDHMLILGQRHLRNALAEYARHYNGRRTKGYSRNPRSVSQATPSTTPIERRQVLGGLIREYHRAA